MRLDLPRLLELQPIVHPTQIKSITLANGSMTMIVAGYPWWTAHRDFADRAQLTIIFEGISQGFLDVSFTDGSENKDEDLENFYVQSLEGVDWAQPYIHT